LTDRGFSSLRAQAQDIRDTGRRAVMEEGGRKEIATMVTSVNQYLSTLGRGGPAKGAFTHR
jgi:tight adherence protein C